MSELFKVYSKLDSINRPQQESNLYYIIMMEVIKSEMHFLVFVNTKSGNGDGKRFIELGYPQFTIRYQSQLEARLNFYDLFSKDSREAGIQYALRFVNQGRKDFRIIICGGDGTIPWVLGELLKVGIDLTSIVLGIIPIGTGNDFSRSLGWGTDPVKVSVKNFEQLGQLVKKWMNATIGFYDMWDVEVQTFENGMIYDIKDQKEIERTQTSFKKMFSNYVGIGLDARVVYTVQKHRTPYAFLNKVAYGIVGFCNWFRWMKRLEDKVESFGETSQSQNSQKNFVQEDPFDQSSKVRTTIQNMEIDKEMELTQGNKKYPLKPGYCGLVCLNCTSYMAGLRKVWKTKSIAVENKSNSSFQEQRVDDGMVEFVSFKTELNLALERLIRSGSKVLQGRGPFELRMKVPVADQITHMQIDGESIKIKNLKSYRITKTSRISDHRLRVMVNNEQS